VAVALGFMRVAASLWADSKEQAPGLVGAGCQAGHVVLEDGTVNTVRWEKIRPSLVVQMRKSLDGDQIVTKSSLRLD